MYIHINIEENNHSILAKKAVFFIVIYFLFVELSGILEKKQFYSLEKVFLNNCSDLLIKTA